MKGIVISLIAVAICAGASEAKKTQGTTTRFVGDEFTKIMNFTSSDIEYIPGSPRVEIIGSKEERDNIMLVSSDNTLKIYSNYDSFDDESTKIKVYGNNVESINLYGSGDAKIGDLTGRKLSLIVFGSGDIDVRSVKATILTLGVYGSGDMIVGRAEASTSAKVSVGGSGDIEVRKMNSGSVEANVMGSGDLDINLVKAKSLRAVVMGSGDITIAGECTNAKLVCQGSGNINAHGLKAVRVSKIVQGSGDIEN